LAKEKGREEGLHHQSSGLGEGIVSKNVGKVTHDDIIELVQKEARKYRTLTPTKAQIKTR